MIIENISQLADFDRRRGVGSLYTNITRDAIDNFLVETYGYLFDNFENWIKIKEDDPTKLEQQNISLMQYLCTRVHENHFAHHHSLYSHYLDRDVKYLNFGSGCGYLEYWFKHYNLGKDVVGLEWEGQNAFFQRFRSFYGVDGMCNYICNSIYDDNFEITSRGGGKPFQEHGIETAILHRFFPVWDHHYEEPDAGKLKRIFGNLRKYGIKEVLISTRSISRKMPTDEMALIMDNARLKRHEGTWEMWFVNIENIV